MAFVRSLFPRPCMVIDYFFALSTLAIDDVEVGVIVRDGGPGVAAHRTDEDSVGVLQIVHPQVAWEAKERSARIVLRQSCEIGTNLSVSKASLFSVNLAPLASPPDLPGGGGGGGELQFQIITLFM